MNKNAIFFSINDDFSFAAANVIMGLNQHSHDLLQTCDVIIFHDGISEKNKLLLSSLHENIVFKDMVFPEEWGEMLSHKATVKCGSYVICKLMGFFLIDKYEKVLHLDADMLIRGDISELFEIEVDIAWRRILAWDAKANFSSLVAAEENINSGNGGLILFTHKLRKYDIGSAEIINAFGLTKDLKRGGTDERVISWIVYENRMNLYELDVDLYNVPVRNVKPETRIVHFVGDKVAETKPWKSLASYLYFDDWAENYRTWLNMGGEGPINFTKDDYFALFGFDREIELLELRKKYNRLYNSKSQKITKPLRWLYKKIRSK